jgi:uncharacterized protein YqeY
MRKQIADAIKTAMKAGDKARLSTLRLVSARIKDVDLAAQGAGKPEASAADLTEALAKMVKQRRESIEHFKAGSRPDLVAQEEAEIAVIESYLPKGLSAAEMAAAIEQVVKETGAASQKDMGKVMALLKERFAGQMDFAAASAAVKNRLTGGKG